MSEQTNQQPNDPTNKSTKKYATQKNKQTNTPTTKNKQTNEPTNTLTNK